MDLRDLTATQRSFDEKHGWTPQPGDPQGLFRFLQEDTIGLTGEVGEIANIVKRVALDSRRGSVPLPELLHAALSELTEEVIDCLIYLVRLSSYLDIDLSSAYLSKLKRNEERFKCYENKQSE